MVPHGMAVALTAPEAFRWTFDADPERHLGAARLLDPRHGPRWEAEPRDVLPGVLLDLMRDLDLPNGLYAVGYDEGDVGPLVEGAVKQQRLLATSPKEVTEDALAGIFTDPYGSGTSDCVVRVVAVCSAQRRWFGIQFRRDDNGADAPAPAHRRHLARLGRTAR